ncbi:MAG: hypothetical protein LAT78_13790 [Roseinatronobacter sp.]|jgi:hypothetical protein|nr:hypothetical protein [Roseinatronobacter sp.]
MSFHLFFSRDSFSIMPLRQFDTHLVRYMITLAGDALQDQLPADFERCASVLRDMPQTAGLAQQRRALHELRGLALAIGAEQLASLCEGIGEREISAELRTHLAEASTDIAQAIRNLRATAP